MPHILTSTAHLKMTCSKLLSAKIKNMHKSMKYKIYFVIFLNTIILLSLILRKFN